MNSNFENSFSKLQQYVEEENYKGWDPYDGLNSKVFQAIPFIKNNRFCRLVWIQGFKKSPINFRKLLLVEKGYNSKGIALFLSAYCRLYTIEPTEKNVQKIKELSTKLLEMKADGWSGYCWGYNFDWQARAFFQPKNTPTVVASVYASWALLEAYEILQDKKLLDAAESCCSFILKDLNRNYDAEGDFCFSYSPLDKSIVFNASLLGSRLLSKMYSLTKNELYKIEAKKSVSYCVKHQQSNGAWAYGLQSFHYWIDNFHTGFNLECIAAYQKYTGDTSFETAISKGFEYYINNFFEEDGKPKYYNNKTYPIDIHAPAQLVITLYELGLIQKEEKLCSTVLNWTLQNMQDNNGYFYYQINQSLNSKIPYIRWAQAWMFFALATYKKAFHENRIV
ncbi:MAG TPA: hypothetical protein PKI98_08595 [Chitinophagaceae bacterium]|nr:hypothetical protein [Chitinophagaceae bacterium]